MARKPAVRPSPKTKDNAKPAGWEVFVERHGFAVAFAGLAVLLAAFFNPLVFGGQGFEPPDVISSIAHRPYLEESFSSSGSLLERYPQWTPYIFSGMPSFGSLIAAPYTNPMSLILTPIPYPFRLVVFYLLMGSFTWLFLRRRKLDALPALFGAVAFVFCAHVITLIMFGHNSKVANLVFLPLVLLVTDGLWERPSLKWIALLGLSLGTMLVTSHLQVSYYTLLTAGLYLVIGSVAGIRGSMGIAGVAKRLGGWAFGFASGLAASAVLFLPVHEYADHSIRGGTGGGLPYDYATSWSLHPLEMSTFFVPSFLGFGQTTYWGWMPFTDFPHYMGILTLFFAVLTLLLWPRERFNLTLALVALFSLILSFGRHVPFVYDLMFNYFPYFNKFRVPSMILLLFQFAVAVLAAVGIHRLSTLTDSALKARVFARIKIVGGVFAAIVLGLGGLLAGGGMNATLLRRLSQRGLGLGLEGQTLSAFASQRAALVRDMVGQDTVVVGLILVLGLLLLAARLKGKISAGAMVAGLILLTVVDLWMVDHRPADYRPRGDRSTAFVANSTVQFLQQDKEPYRILPLTGQGLDNSWFAYFKIPSIRGYHPAKIKIYQDLIDEQGPVGLVGSLSRGNFNVVNMLNMKYLVADQEISGGPLVAVHRGDQFIMENRSVLPRMWFVDRARVVADEASHLNAVSDPSWKPREEAIVFSDPGPLDPGTGGTAVMTSYEPRQLTAQINSPGNSLLVMSEVFYEPGWEAWLDGEPVDVLRADYVLRSIVVPAGSHELKMRFDPPAFRTGVIMSLSSYTVLLLMLAASFIVERRRRPSAA